jgi:GT2 family glycosyltransferase
MNKIEDDLTIFMIAYNSNFKIEKIIKKINPKIKILIIENSNLLKTKIYFENKYKNMSVILNKINTGMTGGINLAFKNIKTKYSLYLDMDVDFNVNIIKIFYNYAIKIKNFAFLAPNHHKREYPDSFKDGSAIEDTNLISMKIVHAHFLFYNMSSVNKIGPYDEKIFFYYDETDYCLRAIKKKLKIFIIKNIKVEHLGGKSYNEELLYKIEPLRHWHLMWGKYYFHKKHYGKINALINTLPDLIQSFLKMSVLFFIDKNRFNIHKNKLSGLINSILNKKSWKRL